MPAAWGHALVTRVDNGSSNDGTVLDAWFHELGWGESAPTTDRFTDDQHHALRGVRVSVATIVIDTDTAPSSAIDVYLRLHLLSHRLAKPRTLNLDGAFGLLTNVAWTTIGPILPESIDQVRWEERRSGRLLNVHGLDKFPRMTDYVVPSGVRIADANRVRLGAHLSTGTTVMHEGFCNFNAGTLGASMVEGRISAGVVVGDGSDIGGGASIMGTLSGGGKEVVSIGERCLLGANAGIGISLGDECIVEAGLYVTGGSLITLPDGEVVKGRTLSGASGLLFRRNSVTGAIEATQRSGNWGGLISNPGLQLAHAIASIAGPTGQIRVPEWVPKELPASVRRALADCEVDGGADGPTIEPWWGEPGLSPAERVFGWCSFEVLAYKTGNPETPVNAIPPRAWKAVRWKAPT